MARAKVNPETGLTEKQDRFCLEYVKNGGNATAAYRATYATSGTEATVNRAAKELTDNPKIAARLAALRAPVVAKAMEGAALSKEWVLSRLMIVAERCMQSYPVLDRKGNPVLVETPDGGAALAYEFNAPGVNKALELLGQEVGCFVKKVEQGKPGDFAGLADMTDDQLEREAREALAEAVKGGFVKVLPVTKGTRKAT